MMYDEFMMYGESMIYAATVLSTEAFGQCVYILHYTHTIWKER